jgi:hypothetical protein
MSQIIGGTGLIGLLSEIFRHLQKTDSREIRGVTEIRKFLTLKTKRFGGDRHEDPAVRFKPFRFPDYKPPCTILF